MRGRRLVFFFGLAAALAIGIGLRLSTRKQLTAGGRARALTSDDHYHLRRARFAAAHYPRTIIFDPLMNFPRGGVAIWPPLFDVALATPARLLHGAGASPDQVERGALWVPVAFAAGAILFAGLLGRLVAGQAAGVVLALFVAVSPGHILWTQYGHTDQHVAESFFGLLVLWLFLKSRFQIPDSRFQEAPGARHAPWNLEPGIWNEISTGAALALAVLAWQGAIFWGAIIALSLLLEAVATRESVLRPAILILGVAALVTAPATALWLGGARPPLTYISFGFFQPLFLAALAGGTVLADTILRAARRQLEGREIAWRAAALAATAAAVLPFTGSLLSGLARGVGYVAGLTSEVSAATGYVSYPRNWLSGIFEARPLLADGVALPTRQLSAAFFLSPLVILVWASRAAQKIRPGVNVTLAVWGAVTLFLALSQRLNVYYAAPLAGLCLIEAADLLARVFGKTPGARAALALACGVALALPLAPGIAEEIKAVHVPGSDLFATLDWMRLRLPHTVDAYDARLLSTTPPSELTGARSVLAPWSLGHMILYDAELPVVANNFGYGFLDSIRFFLAESEEEALEIARRGRVRWVLATDLVPRMNDYAGYLGRPPSLRVTEKGPLPNRAYFSTLQSRLYDFDGLGAEFGGERIPPLAHFRLLHHSRSAISRGGRWLARWKVFEIVY
ncbi:MAG TPA: STT3 domain-containing protein [Thermoanaerobaculia bacterium]|nr:STT3 domain-containing protein [Thermoanaerobaculia bacterium]